MGGYDVDPVKLKQDIRDILVQDIKVLLSQEVGNISTASLPGASNPALDDLPDKMDQLLEMAKRKSIDLQKSDRMTETKLDEETLNKMMNEFQQSMQEILRKDVVENLMAQKNDRKQFENSLDE